MTFYRVDPTTIKIEADNCLVIVKDKLSDRFGRNVTSIRIISDKYAGSNKVIRVGGCENIRCITLKKKNR
jgi:hypothetical protein